MHREFLEEFLRIYESEPCLWLVKNKDYHNRIKKDAAYERLAKKLREIEPKASKDTVIKKINNVRSAHRKEQKKVKSSIKSGAAPDEVYKPRLWYYDTLSFLADQDGSKASRLDLGSDVDDDDEDINSELEERSVLETQPNRSGPVTVRSEGYASEPSPGSSSVPHFRQRKPESDAEAPLKHFKKPRIEEDRFDLVGKTVAMKLRGLPKQQMLIAENVINHTLFQAEMGTLSLSHGLVSEPVHQQNQHYYHHAAYDPGAVFPNYPHSPQASLDRSPTPTSQHSDTC